MTIDMVCDYLSKGGVTMAKAIALLNPTAKVLNKAPKQVREEAQWYASMGMPVQGTTLHALKHVVKVRREMK
jgi:hypothetical protein